MQKFLLGLLTGLIFAVVAGVIFVFSLMRLGERRPQIADHSTLILHLDGGIPEKAPVDIPIPFFGTKQQVTVHNIWSMLRKAAVDTRIRAVVLVPERIGAGWGKLDEIRMSLAEFRKSGKPLVAFLRNPRSREYYIATAAEKIYMSPEDLLDVKGLRAEFMFFKKTLDKIGVQVEIQHIGKYKDAGDMFTETAMTPETREVMNSVLDGVYGRMLRVFGEGRKKSPEAIAAILDQGPFTAKDARAKGLIDDLRYEDQVYGDLKTRLKLPEIRKVSHADYMRSPVSGWEGRKKIALVTGEGDILRGDVGITDDENFSAETFIRLLRQVAGDSSVQGVILRVNSPGGDAIASDDILREVKLLSKRKPLVVSMSDLAASGGYYVSMTGDPIVAYPNTYTGSIGIIYGKLNLRGLYEKLGIQKEILIRGKNADIDTDYQALTESGRAKLHETLTDFYKGFVGKVAEARRRSYQEVEPLAQGRVWLGAQAKANGLVDEIGGIDKAIELVKRKAKIPASEKIRLAPYPARKSIFEQLMKTESPDQLLEARIQGFLGGVNYKLWSRGGIMRFMPYQIRVE